MSRSEGIPVMVYLDRATFAALEVSAERRGKSMRELIADHMRQSTVGVIIPTKHGPHRHATSAEVDEWERMARAGCTNREIAERWHVSKSLVSRRLRERGIMRQMPTTGPRREVIR